MHRAMHSGRGTAIAFLSIVIMSVAAIPTQVIAQSRNGPYRRSASPRPTEVPIRSGISRQISSRPHVVRELARVRELMEINPRAAREHLGRIQADGRHEGEEIAAARTELHRALTRWATERAREYLDRGRLRASAEAIAALEPTRETMPDETREVVHELGTSIAGAIETHASTYDSPAFAEALRASTVLDRVQLVSPELAAAERNVTGNILRHLPRSAKSRPPSSFGPEDARLLTDTTAMAAVLSEHRGAFDPRVSDLTERLVSTLRTRERAVSDPREREELATVARQIVGTLLASNERFRIEAHSIRDANTLVQLATRHVSSDRGRDMRWDAYELCVVARIARRASLGPDGVSYDSRASLVESLVRVATSIEQRGRTDIAARLVVEAESLRQWWHLVETFSARDIAREIGSERLARARAMELEDIHPLREELEYWER